MNPNQAQPILRVIRAAPLTQLQDGGRFGALHLGFSHSGPMDSRAFTHNYQLLDDNEHAAQVEIALGGLMLEVLADCTIAISGAYMKPTLDNKPLTNYCAHNLKQGQRLQFAFAKYGIYAYLAVKGGFAGKAFLESYATTDRLGISAQTIGDGSILSAQAITQISEPRGVSRGNIDTLQQHTLDVIPAYQYDNFSLEMHELFTAQDYQIQAGDRMGTRLRAEEALSFTGGELLSEGLLPGAIQITNEGQPIVLQQDAQSLGGYPKIGALSESSRCALAQSKPGDTVRFRFLS
ncbi:biotin-dependent carboxyltransferase family protein [Suttonella sp. R2A3]|uniref:5-oxoprolinase subunit C family protein n=1 Tax=Suttonella sp. R2A3 TaxID=2908648 RepID=UPI001F2A413A|nr:biotin-dependent carboxyltransferase family protein [Suttonella sp. R2A3]UJF24977.1 biotin-dependent carboxyltransferase family protein [Suttonella sp. R2A3]